MGNKSPVFWLSDSCIYAKGRAGGHPKPFTNISQHFIISSLSTAAARLSPKVHALWLTHF